MGSLLCVGLFASEPGVSDARLRELYRHGLNVPSSAPVDVLDLTGRSRVIQITIPDGFLAQLATPPGRRLTSQGPDNVMVTARGTIRLTQQIPAPFPAQGAVSASRGSLSAPGRNEVTDIIPFN